MLGGPCNPEKYTKKIVYLFFHDIAPFLIDYIFIIVRYIHRKTNSITNWIAAYITCHSEFFFVNRDAEVSWLFL